MADVTGTIGQEYVELNNAATESTLKALLVSINTLNQSVLKSPGSSGGGSDNMAAMASASSAATSALTIFAKGTVVAGAIVGGLVNSVGEVSGSLIKFSEDLIQGQGGVSSFYHALESLPLGMGMVAGLFAKIAELQEQELTSYRTLTTAGINFGGQLTNLRDNALSLGMTLDQFSGFMKNNSKQLSLMGGTVNEGAESFTKLGVALRDDPVGKNLRALGFTTEQVNQGLMDYISVSGGRSAAEMKDTKKLSESTAGYLSELDMLASITGETREQQASALKEQTKNAAWQNYLQSLDEEGRKNATNALASSLAAGGKGAADALQSKLLGIPPVSKEAQMFVSMAGKGADAINDFAKSVKGGANGQEMINNAQAKMTTGLADEGKRIGTQLGAALTMIPGAASGMASAMLSADTRMKNAGAANEAEYKSKVIDKAIADQESRSKSSASLAAESEKSFKDMGAAIYGALQPALNAISPIINSLATEFLSFTKDSGVLQKVRDGLTTLAVYVSNFAKNLMDPAGREKIINDLKYYFSLMMIEVKKAIIPWFSNKNATDEISKLDKAKSIADNKSGAVNYDAGLTKKLAALAAEDALAVSSKAEKTTKSQPVATPEPIVNTAHAAVKTQAKAIVQQQQTQAIDAQHKEDERKLREAADIKSKEDLKVDTNLLTPTETLIAELKILNKQTTDTVRYMRDTADYCKRSVDAIKALSNNLYA